MTYGEATADYAMQVLALGPMSRTLRAEDYKRFIDANFFDSASAPVFHSAGTHCAIFARGCLVGAGAKPKGRRPAVTGITSWLGVSFFSGKDWIGYADIGTLLPGDVLYWCGRPSDPVWKDDTNGHVGIVLYDGEGWMQRTAEGGGGDGSLCRMSDKPKDVRVSWGRPLRGVWRPDNMKPEHVTPVTGTPLTLRRGSRGDDVKRVQEKLGITADGIFGPRTEGAIKSFQISKGLVADGVCGPKTWAALLVTFP